VAWPPTERSGIVTSRGGDGDDRVNRGLIIVAGLEGRQRGHAAGVGATIGAIVFRHPPPSAEAAIRAVDDRMYEAKRAGQDQLSLVGPKRPGATPAP
jgi:GGDEF domain-containing protein